MLDVKSREKEIIAFWEQHKIYERVKKKNEKGKKFYFMDGPPYATGKIHLGTALNKILKDIAMRMKRMQGFDVFDRPGYDTHGVPIEFQIEKEIGSKSKKDIETYGIKKFVQKCKEYAIRYIDVMNEQFKNLGVWMDWKHPYVTLSDDYVEAIWHAFKEADKQGLLYLGKYPVHVCPRCETAVAYNEIEYGRQKDNSVVVKFPLKKKKKTFFIIWTTTPWTLPGNTGIMAHPDVTYQEIETSEGERWILAKECVQSVMSACSISSHVKKEWKGKELEGWEYEHPLASQLRIKIKNGYRIVLSARYVSTKEGTGLVHCAPGHGKEDYEVGKQNRLDMPSPVQSNGILTEEAGVYAGKRAREVDREMIEDLKKKKYIVYAQDYVHDYPLCWRDKTPLLMISQPQWFLKVSRIHKNLLKENEKTHWVPDWMKLRMKAWLEGVSDWPVSRQRYWGTPLPIWYDAATGEKIVVGSLAELKKLSGAKKIDVHKPGIDEITMKGKKSILRRVPEVLDVWFDSGVSSWAALHYPASDVLLKKYWPADLNIEGRDQVRGWWNSQMILSQIAFRRKPFESVLVHGMILDIGKKKMSKSVGNSASPEELVARYGVDYVRYYFAKFSKGEDFAFDEDSLHEIRKVLTILINLSQFIQQLSPVTSKLAAEDRWILSRYHTFVRNCSEHYNSYRFHEVIQLFEQFLVQDMSRTYIQCTRERADETTPILREMFEGILCLLAPVIPFTTEALWQMLREKKIVKEKSIHLCSWPKADKKDINTQLEEQFALLLKIIEGGMAARDAAKIGLRWPLASAHITIREKEALSKELQEIVKKQLNVKALSLISGKELKVELNTTLTPTLEAEGFARELARKIQAERKHAGLQKEDTIEVFVSCDDAAKSMFEQHLAFLQERTNAKTIQYIDEKLLKKPVFFTIKEKKIGLSFRNSEEVRS